MLADHWIEINIAQDMVPTVRYKQQNQQNHHHQQQEYYYLVEYLQDSEEFLMDSNAC